MSAFLQQYAGYIILALATTFNSGWAIVNLRSQGRQTREYSDLRLWITKEMKGIVHEQHQNDLLTFALATDLVALAARVPEAA